MTPYFERLGSGRFRATSSVQGAWNTGEQHIAPALGLLTHAVDLDRDARGSGHLRLARLSFDILGTLPIDVVDIAVRVIRPGRTIELVEATLSHDDRPAVVLRAWMLRTSVTSVTAGSYFPSMTGPDQCDRWDAACIWPGEFVRTVEARRHESAPGRAQFWLRPLVPLLAGEPISATSRGLSILDIANGITPRTAPDRTAFPNLDTTVHLFAEPTGEWLGFDARVSFGAEGIGLTHAVLHDHTGPIGTMEQILTIRPR